VIDVIEVGPFLIWTHLVFFLLGLWIATELFVRLAVSAGLSLQLFRDYAWWFPLAFILGGRLIAVLAEYRVYHHDPLRTFIFWDGNMSFLGAAIGVGVLLAILTRGTRAVFLQWLDALLPATSLGLACDWIGKFAGGSSYGKPTDMFLGVTYDSIMSRYSVPIHPVQLYYAFFFLILTLVLLVVRKHARRAGAETLAGIILASLASFWFEFYRGDFGIPVFATQIDFVVLILLFLSLGVFAALEMSLSARTMLIYESTLTVILAAYLFIRPQLDFETYELRFTQLLSVLALLGTVVYVVVQRRRHPHV
jgi:phosphatidylglycerol:prolipoprotein diacylglycerol transferase